MNYIKNTILLTLLLLTSVLRKELLFWIKIKAKIFQRNAGIMKKGDPCLKLYSKSVQLIYKELIIARLQAINKIKSRKEKKIYEDCP